jgi:ribosomal protein S18 acetylase RimI-like enzyme
MTTETSVRRATRWDIPGLTYTLGRAFFEDPLAIWACQSTRLRPGLLKSIHGARIRQLLVHDEIWTTSELASVALWAPPGRWQTTILQDVLLARGLLLRPRLLARIPRLAFGLSEIRQRHPRNADHWYLSLLGTDPDAQGRGLGSAVLQPVLEICDRSRVGAYLESSSQRNLNFYERYGFQTTGEVRVPGGPPLWTMWRDAGSH